jgi:hypothetical protein
MPVSATSREAYYKELLNGRRTKKRERIMHLWLSIGHPMTRHEAASWFWPKAYDGGEPIPLQSVCSSVHSLIGDKQNPDYLQVDHIGPDPITGNDAEFLVPIGDKWLQRRMF